MRDRVEISNEQGDTTELPAVEGPKILVKDTFTVTVYSLIDQGPRTGPHALARDIEAAVGADDRIVDVDYGQRVEIEQ